MIGSLLALAIIREQSHRWIVSAAVPMIVVFGGASAALLIARPAREGWPMQIFGSIILGLAFAGLIAHVVTGPMNGSLKRVLESKFLRFFGKYSYGLYVFHHLFFPVWLAILDGLYRATGIYRVAVMGMVVMATTISIGLSLLSWRFMEQPLLGFKKYFG